MRPYLAHLLHCGSVRSQLCFLTLQYAQTFDAFSMKGMRSLARGIVSVRRFEGGHTSGDAAAMMRSRRAADTAPVDPHLNPESGTAGRKMTSQM